MKISNLVIVGALAAALGMGTASAGSVDTRDLSAAPHVTVDTLTGHDASCDTNVTDPAPAHDSSVSGHDSGIGGAAGGASPHPQVSHRSLGWQSLLPGSIQ